MIQIIYVVNHLAYLFTHSSWAPIYFVFRQKQYRFTEHFVTYF